MTVPLELGVLPSWSGGWLLLYTESPDTTPHLYSCSNPTGVGGTGALPFAYVCVKEDEAAAVGLAGTDTCDPWCFVVAATVVLYASEGPGFRCIVTRFDTATELPTAAAALFATNDTTSPSRAALSEAIVVVPFPPSALSLFSSALLFVNSVALPIAAAGN